jgi:ubiquinone/menaquinone biosynthesis C-methylase UbiE
VNFVGIDANQRLYDKPSAVRLYASLEHLEPPEAAVLELLADELPEMRMLDVGVGAGRTAFHFAPRVRSYVGVDYAPMLIEAARRRFRDAPAVRFEVGDARSMPMFEDESFDFVLFSVNGLDCLDHDGRLAALREFRRLTRAGGVLFFSSHNLGAIAWTVSLRRLVRELRAGRSPVRYVAAVAKRMPAQVLQRVGNPSPSHLVRRDAVLLNKRWPPRNPVTTYHVKPVEVRRQLGATGWDLERVLLPSGEEIAYEASLELREPLWLNFLARARGADARGGGA